jgi:hypothetical protein
MDTVKAGTVKNLIDAFEQSDQMLGSVECSFELAGYVRKAMRLVLEKCGEVYKPPVKVSRYTPRGFVVCKDLCGRVTDIWQFHPPGV